MMNFKLGDFQVNEDVVQGRTKYECQSINGKVVGSTLIWSTQSSFSPSIHVPVSLGEQHHLSCELTFNIKLIN